MFLNFSNPVTNQAGEYMIMNSATKRQFIIDTLLNYIDEGGDPNDISIDYTDVLDTDKQIIKDTVEQYYIRRHYQ